MVTASSDGCCDFVLHSTFFHNNNLIEDVQLLRRYHRKSGQSTNLRPTNKLIIVWETMLLRAHTIKPCVELHQRWNLDIPSYSSATFRISGVASNLGARGRQWGLSSRYFPSISRDLEAGLTLLQPVATSRNISSNTEIGPLCFSCVTRTNNVRG